MSERVVTPYGVTISPRETLEIGNVRVHIDRWNIYIEDGTDWFVASADRWLTEGDGIYFDSFPNYLTELR